MFLVHYDSLLASHQISNQDLPSRDDDDDHHHHHRYHHHLGWEDRSGRFFFSDTTKKCLNSDLYFNNTVVLFTWFNCEFWWIHRISPEFTNLTLSEFTLMIESLFFSFSFFFDPVLQAGFFFVQYYRVYLYQVLFRQNEIGLLNQNL